MGRPTEEALKQFVGSTTQNLVHTTGLAATNAAFERPALIHGVALDCCRFPSQIFPPYNARPSTTAARSNLFYR